MSGADQAVKRIPYFTSPFPYTLYLIPSIKQLPGLENIYNLTAHKYYERIQNESVVFIFL
jgi:hypothetical protein